MKRERKETGAADGPLRSTSAGTRRRAPAPARLEELRRLAARYGLSLELLDRIALRPREVAGALGVGLRKIEDWIASGRLGARKPDEGVVVVPLHELLAFLDDHPYVPSGTRGSLRERARRLIDAAPRVERGSTHL